MLPRRGLLVEEAARHVAVAARVLNYDADFQAKTCGIVRTGEAHFSLAFTYAWMPCADPGLVNWRAFWIGVRMGRWPAVIT